LARAGLEVHVLEAQQVPGGGARTLDSDLAEGLRYDVCSAVHALALASPFFRRFDLAARGVELAVREVSYAQLLEGGRAAVAYLSLVRTASELGCDSGGWWVLFASLVEMSGLLTKLVLGFRRELPLGQRGGSGL